MAAKRPEVPRWMWPNVVSLDAPLIAVLWQDFLNRCYPGTLQPAGRAVLGLTVWAIYLLDRLLDVRHPATARETIRHAFYRRHRCLALALLTAVLAADLLITALWLRPIVLTSGLLVAACVSTYLAVFPSKPDMPGKKAAAAVLFTAGVFLIRWVGTPRAATELALPAVFFSAICLVNLLLIQRWEQAQPTRTPWILLIILPGLPGTARGLPWFTALTCSAAALATLTLSGNRLPRNARSVLADAALLTPLLFW